MTNNPKFTIVIPTFNRAKFIKKSILSALSQTYENFEVIVIDDGSTDNTEEIIATIKSTKLIYHKKINSERGAARNTGAKLGKGDYINFLDSDDILYPNHLEIAHTMVLQYHNPEIFHLGYEIKDDGGKILKHGNKITGNVNELLIEGNLMSCNGVFVKRSIILENPFIEDRNLAALEDWELWIRLASRFPIHYNNTITSYMVNHDDRSVFSNDKERLITRKDLLLKYLFSDPKVVEFLGEKKKKLIANANTYVALHLTLMINSKKEALKHLWIGFVNDPSIVLKRRFFAIIKHLLINTLRTK